MLSARRSGRRTEQVFDIVADDFRPGFRDVSPRAANKAYNETVQSILKIASRTARDAAAASQLVGVGEEPNLVGKIEHAWLSHDEFLAVRSMINTYICKRITIWTTKRWPTTAMLPGSNCNGSTKAKYLSSNLTS